MSVAPSKPAIIREPVLRPAGDMGLLVEFGAGWSPEISRAVTGFSAAFDSVAPAGVIETVPTIRSFLIRYDPLALDPERLAAKVREVLAERDWYASEPPARRVRFTLPVVYGGTEGPDLGAVADLMGLSEAAAVDAHAGVVLSVAMLGFAPGCAYLAGLGPEWDLPRQTGLTPEVPAGSILVAIRQTVLPANPMPTGWRRIGRSPVVTFDLARPKPFLLAPGDEVVFEPVSAAKAARFDASPLWERRQ